MSTTAIIPLTQGKVAIVDAEDYERLSVHKWSAQRKRRKYGDVWYARKAVRVNGKASAELMHRFILGITDRKIEVDHWDLDGLNNKKSNLRACTNTQNQANKPKRSGKGHPAYKGLCVYRLGQWRVQIQRGRRKVHIGVFKDAIEAAKAYDAAARHYFGEFARLNFPNEVQL